MLCRDDFGDFLRGYLLWFSGTYVVGIGGMRVFGVEGFYGEVVLEA